MNTENLDAYIRKIADINGTTFGMGSAAAGIRGAASIGDQTAYQLKLTIIKFAYEYRGSRPDSTILRGLAQEIEGSLLTLQLTSAISNEKFEQLRTDLQNLVAAKTGD